MMIRKYSVRGRNVQWASEHLNRVVAAGDIRRAFRAAALIMALETWLHQNAPLAVATYNE